MARPFDLNDILNFDDSVLDLVFGGLPGDGPANGKGAAAEAPFDASSAPGPMATAPMGPLTEVPVGDADFIAVRAPMDFSVSNGAITQDLGGFSYARPGSGDPTGGGGGGGGGGKPGGNDGGGGLLTTYTSGDPGIDDSLEFNIRIDFSGSGWTAELQQLFIDAADYLSTIIVGDLSNERVPGYGKVDDIAITAQLTAIDGTGGILGGAAVSSWRNHDLLPATALMQFDTADVQTYLDNGLFGGIVLHEMIHALGFGGQWDRMGLVTDYGGDLRFTGALATWEYNNDPVLSGIAAGDPLSGFGVAVESDGTAGDGTYGVHWDEALYTEELMTGYISLNGWSLSDMTIAALEDMGYDTTYDESVLLA